MSVSKLIFLSPYHTTSRPARPHYALSIFKIVVRSWYDRRIFMPPRCYYALTTTSLRLCFVLATLSLRSHYAWNTFIASLIRSHCVHHVLTTTATSASRSYHASITIVPRLYYALYAITTLYNKFIEGIKTFGTFNLQNEKWSSNPVFILKPKKLSRSWLNRSGNVLRS